MPTNPSKKSKAERDAEAKARRAVVDEYGALDAELAPAKAKGKRLEELAAVIRAWHKDSAAGGTFIERGDKFHVVVNPKAETTILAPSIAIYEALGHEKFLGAAKLTLTALESAATEAQLAMLTRKERIGSRMLKAVPAA